MLDEAYRRIIADPYHLNLMQVDGRHELDWADNLRMCVEKSRYVNAHILDDGFAGITGLQQIGPVHYNIWAAFTNNVVGHAGTILRFTRKWFKDVGAEVGVSGRMYAWIPDNDPVALRFDTFLGFKVWGQMGDGRLLLERSFL